MISRDKIYYTIFFILLVLVLLTLSFLIFSGLIYLVFMLFGFEFSWKICIGIYLLLIAINLVLGIRN